MSNHLWKPGIIVGIIFNVEKNLEKTGNFREKPGKVRESCMCLLKETCYVSSYEIVTSGITVQFASAKKISIELYYFKQTSIKVFSTLALQLGLSTNQQTITMHHCLICILITHVADIYLGPGSTVKTLLPHPISF